jgi:hypothetical protein
MPVQNLLTLKSQYYKMVQTRAGNMSSANVVIKAACAINQLIYNLQFAQPAGYIFVLVFAGDKGVNSIHKFF